MLASFQRTKRKAAALYTYEQVHRDVATSFISASVHARVEGLNHIVSFSKPASRIDSQTSRKLLDTVLLELQPVHGRLDVKVLLQEKKRIYNNRTGYLVLVNRNNILCIVSKPREVRCKNFLSFWPVICNLLRTGDVCLILDLDRRGPRRVLASRYE